MKRRGGMTTIHDPRPRHAVKRHVVANAEALALALSAHAQEASEAQPGQGLAEVVITGSRIQRSAVLDSSSPMVTVSSDVLTNKSTVSLENEQKQLFQIVF